MSDARGPSDEPAPRAEIRATRTGWRARLLDDSRSSGAKMLRLLRIVSAAQIAQGVLELVVGLAVGLVLVSWGDAVDPLTIALTVLALVVGPVRIVAGRLNRDFRGRLLAITTAVLGLPAIACVCLPTSPLVLILLIVVHRNGLVREAFGLREEGASRSEVERWLNRPPNPRRAE